MPITLLHLGLMAPFIHHRRGYAALAAFTLVNLWIDLNAILAVLTGGPLPAHTEASHTIYGALIIGLMVAMPGAIPKIRSTAWVAGAFFGAISHILLDALVHADMNLTGIEGSGNPLYLGLMTHVSVLLVIPTIYLIARCVSDGLGAARRFRAGLRQRNAQRSP